MSSEQTFEPEKDRSKPKQLGNLTRRAFLGWTGKTVAGIGLAAAVPAVPAAARDQESVPPATNQEKAQESEIEYDLSDYRLPFDGKYQITQGRSELTIDGQKCTAEFHTTHQGLAKESIDFLIPEGVSLKAAQAGEVTYVGWMHDYGNLVIIKHDDNLTSWYGHLSEMSVGLEQQVQQGEKIGKSGKSGTYADHLHFEIRNENNQSIPITINGLQYFGGFESSCSYKERFEGYGEHLPQSFSSPHY